MGRGVLLTDISQCESLCGLLSIVWVGEGLYCDVAEAECIHIYIYTYIHIYTYTYTCRRALALNWHLRLYLLCVRIHACMHACMHMHMHVHVHIFDALDASR